VTKPLPTRATSAAPRDAVTFARKRPAGGFVVKAVGSYVPGLTRKAFEKYGFSAATLLTDWAAIAGPELSTVTAPERLRWPRQAATETNEASEARAKTRAGATLVLRVDSAQALTVQYSAKQIIDRVNAYFGYAAIAELRLIQAPLHESRRPVKALPRPPLEPLTAEVVGVADASLRDALARLGAGIRAAR
jgi:hypothetical protein